MSRKGIPPVTRALGCIVRGVWLETLRRREFSVALILLAVFGMGVGAVSIVGVENPQTGTFLLNLGMSLAAGSAHLLALILACRQFPDEIENRTIHTLLARPVERHVVLLGKWLACGLCGVGVLVLFLGVAWGLAPKMESYSAALLAELLVLQAFSIGLLCAAGVTLSLWLPKAVVLPVTGLWFLGGGAFVRFLRDEFADAPGWVTGVLMAYLPDFSKLDLVTRYTDGGGPLGVADLAGLVLYAVVFTCLLMVAAGRLIGARSV